MRLLKRLAGVAGVGALLCVSVVGAPSVSAEPRAAAGDEISAIVEAGENARLLARAGFHSHGKWRSSDGFAVTTEAWVVADYAQKARTAIRTIVTDPSINTTYSSFRGAFEDSWQAPMTGWLRLPQGGTTGDKQVLGLLRPGARYALGSVPAYANPDAPFTPSDLTQYLESSWDVPWALSGQLLHCRDEGAVCEVTSRQDELGGTRWEVTVDLDLAWGPGPETYVFNVSGQGVLRKAELSTSSGTLTTQVSKLGGQGLRVPGPGKKDRRGAATSRELTQAAASQAVEALERHYRKGVQKFLKGKGIPLTADNARWAAGKLNGDRVDSWILNLSQQQRNEWAGESGFTWDKNVLTLDATAHDGLSSASAKAIVTVVGGKFDVRYEGRVLPSAWMVSHCGTMDAKTAAAPPGGSVVTAQGVSASPRLNRAPKVAVSARARAASSVTYEDIARGQGAAVEKNSTVTVRLCGVGLESRKIFDSSWFQGQDSTFSLDRVIIGWAQGLQGMQVGGRRLVVIPSSLAYGDTPPPGSGIAPGEDLAFVVDLVATS